MTYQEIFDDIKSNTISFISEKSEQHRIDAGIIMEIMVETINDVNYNTVIKALHEMRSTNSNLISQIQTLQADQPSGDE